MNQFCRYTVYEREPVGYLVNPIRCVQAFLCLGCFAFAIYLIVEQSIIHLSFKVILGVTAAAFATITIIDIISTSHYNPIFWKIWIMFAISGAIFFLLCCGVLIATATGATAALIIGEIMFGVTGIMFLIDALYVLNATRKQQSEVQPVVLTPMYIPAETKSITSERQYAEQPEYPQPEYQHVIEEERKSVSYRERIETPVYDYGPPPLQETRPSRCPSRCPMSYGGTFPMSKDAAPLPSPEPLYPEDTRRRSSRTSQTFRGSRNRIGTSSSHTIEKVTERELRDDAIVTPRQNDEDCSYTCDGRPVTAPPLTPSLSERRQTKTDPDVISQRTVERTEEKRVTLPGTVDYAPQESREYSIRETSQEDIISGQGISRKSTEYSLREMPEERLVPSQRRESLEVCHAPCAKRATPQRIVEHTTREISEEEDVLGGEQTTVERRLTERTIERPSQATRKTIDFRPEDTFTISSRQSGPQRAIEPTLREKRLESIGSASIQSSPSTRRPSAESALQRRQSAESSPSRRPSGESSLQRRPTAESSPIRRPSRESSLQRRTIESSPPRRSSAESSQRRPSADRSEHRRSSAESSPHRRSSAESSPQRRGTNRSIESARHRPSQGTSLRESRTETLVQSTSPQESPDICACRTVAISTRMIPKNNGTKTRCQSAPGSPEIKKEEVNRPIKSADWCSQQQTSSGVAYQYQQQQPSMMYHQYVQNPCKCGKTHYQSATTVQGNVIATTCPFFLTQPGQSTTTENKPTKPCPCHQKEKPELVLCSPDNPCKFKDCERCQPREPKKTCSPSAPCGKIDCSCYRRPEPSPPRSGLCSPELPCGYKNCRCCKGAN